jgi:cytochrome bd-type quinol oxidase subunit 1
MPLMSVVVVVLLCVAVIVTGAILATLGRQPPGWIVLGLGVAALLVYFLGPHLHP